MTLIEPIQKEQPERSQSAAFSESEWDSVSDRSQESLLKKKRPSGFWAAFGSTFLTIFLAEMGDKTQLATLLMSAESHSPGIVFAGAALALVTTSLLGVWIGCWLASRVSPRTREIAVATLLLIVSMLLLGSAVTS
ncbi:MAG: UPF0016 domain-containing protein [Cyanobacteria bacterium QH_8_48_120]|nr:MAG: UPF0016 domain-containing protein [Cyanobacteria bacterium QH_1_48_107]PSO56663.1 MAG: UPF0016 domain-containing protein [Cyanobacteria bacterium QH_10_48_56]PSO58583.1 MAG: UPF0016 domain-containing protein [Cyanobacteria bacterium QH_7_48_89]PSO67246.1 MAG: UPF0016 domain-containing protein [Cyanobacteria bacterium QH_6_48_35]PSO70463.1 MAG: UPF0016 domain-containing protein [Cyanobacteria bacterium QH_8_48_120]PSO92339.1 MAG: UPF0016 domain-containing protein [Cyanobacteria bacteriu